MTVTSYNSHFQVIVIGCIFLGNANISVSHNLVKARINRKNILRLIQLNRNHNFNKIFVLESTNLISLLKASIVFILQCKSLGCDQLVVIDHDPNKCKCNNRICIISRQLDDTRILHISPTPDPSSGPVLRSLQRKYNWIAPPLLSRQ